MEKIIYINDLNDLIDIKDILFFEEEPTIFTEKYTLELIETSLQLMDEFTNETPVMYDPNFQEILFEELYDIFYTQFEDHIISSDYVEDELIDLLKDAINIYITTFHNISIVTFNDEYDEEYEHDDYINESQNIKFKIQQLREIPQPTQRTDEWYHFRHNLITASNAYKALGSQASINQLIYEKCQPIKVYDSEVCVNVNTPMHWGQKYEPLSVAIYENNYKTRVDDFGCIKHNKYNFLGASPDGINVDETSDLYGRMLEIKNPVSRKINGIPKNEYWVQMQLQMEVCDLDTCDFLETQFIEYEDMNSYINDLKYNESGNLKELVDATISIDGKPTGIIVYFHKEFKPFYVYKPINLKGKEEILKWEEDTVEMYQSEKYNYTFIKFIYWKLEELSCVLVLRDVVWFNNNIIHLENVWKIIEDERIKGYEHRAPKKRAHKENCNKETSDSNECLLNFNKVVKYNDQYD